MISALVILILLFYNLFLNLLIVTVCKGIHFQLNMEIFFAIFWKIYEHYFFILMNFVTLPCYI
ncbi:hypothetical protein HMPREF3218_0200562 [Prevotella bivia]|nr:hypothetical protein HMPREF3218_0200562 [Prevotella bivia]